MALELKLRSAGQNDRSWTDKSGNISAQGRFTIYHSSFYDNNSVTERCLCNQNQSIPFVCVCVYLLNCQFIKTDSDLYF